MIRINVTIKVKSETRQQVVELLSEMSELSRQEKGCIGYDIMSDNRSDDTLMIIESWENEVVLDIHKQSEHFTRLIPRVRELVTSMKSERFTDMAAVDKAIVRRRSVKKFLPDTVCVETIERLLRAGMYAPSLNDRRPWEFFVIEDQKHRHELVKMFPRGESLKTAPVAVLVCCNTRKAGLDGGNWPQELGACVQNIMLQAHGEGLGSAWVGIYPKMHLVHSVKTYLHLSSEFVPFALVAIGKPAEEEGVVPERYEAAKVHFIVH